MWQGLQTLKGLSQTSTNTCHTPFLTAELGQSANMRKRSESGIWTKVPTGSQDLPEPIASAGPADAGLDSGGGANEVSTSLFDVPSCVQKSDDRSGVSVLAAVGSETYNRPHYRHTLYPRFQRHPDDTSP